MSTISSSHQSVPDMDGAIVQSSATPSHTPEASSPHEKWETALRLWLNWNDAYERMSSNLYEAGNDQRALEDLMDRMEQARQQAIDLSRELLR